MAATDLEGRRHWRIEGPQRQRARVSPAYTRFVLVMKLLLPTLAVVLAVALLAWPSLVPRDRTIVIEQADIEVGDEGLTMVNARFVGLDSEQRPFTVTASSASRNPDDPQIIKLASLQADTTMEDGAWMSLSADNGLFRQKKKWLDLTGNIEIFSDTGYQFHSETAEIDLANGRAWSKTPVQGHGPSGEIQSDRLFIDRDANIARFDGNVHVLIYGKGNDKGG
ncbi:LPS export ABC transporter periplasmic protein LptC [Oceanibacterium hippocampi]|uniref:Lipopolysaccharide-assembly, LptC-related n=1 Tax=Oceanibacterium hippocampi TaxID=745714 RepID=A0A1Y5RQY0_9PROT|nr:LPS export ABC transporter periplasmic protein LptC [Oceanibacterium hippocampi]SLN23230.1 Lipopolysaccharide-assembly, LptC-related [Oceanibacterium hippocampi]